MQEHMNPLFPNSEGEGITGAYELAALLDDSAARMYNGEMNTRLQMARPRIRRTRYGSGMSNEIIAHNARKNKMLLAVFHNEMNDLEEAYANGLIDKYQFKRSKRNLAHAATKLAWTKVTPQMVYGGAARVRVVQQKPIFEVKEKLEGDQLEKLEF